MSTANDSKVVLLSTGHDTHTHLEHEEVGGPPWQEDDLLVGQGGVHHRGGDKVRLQNGDDLAGHPGEHPCRDVVRAHHCRLDVL